MSSIADRQEQIVSDFAELIDWEERYRHIIELGRDLPNLPDDLKQDKNRVRGCQSLVWLHAGLDDDGHVVFQADSDAMIVRGIIAMMIDVYSEAAPDEILQSPPDFVQKVGLDRHLSQTRSNGLRSLVEQMFYYAKAFQTILATKR